MKEPEYTDKERCLDLRCRSKRGETLSREEHIFCRKMFEEFKDWYREIEDDIFVKTAPFGSGITKEYLKERREAEDNDKKKKDR